LSPLSARKSWNTSIFFVLKKGSSISLLSILLSLSNRELLLQEKRKMNNEEDAYGQGIPIMDHIYACFEKEYNLEQLSDLVSSLYSPNRHRLFYGSIGILKLLSDEGIDFSFFTFFIFLVNPRPIQLIIETGILPQIIGFLRRKDEIQLQVPLTLIFSFLTSLISYKQLLY